ncbi:oligosaccharide flippase family protein [bacterium SCSIO 12643]|nr:oligosaccharide flippase family protein [bacterium SCSIO 12643]
MQLISYIKSSKKMMVLTDQIVFSGNSFLLTILMARILTPEKFGVFASIILGLYLCISILNALVVQPYQVSIAKEKNKEAYTSYSFFYQILLLAIVLILLNSLSFLQLEFLADFNELIMPLMLFASGFIMQDYLRKIFLAQSELDATVLIDGLTAFLQIFVLIAGLYFSFSLYHMLWLLGLAYLPSLLMGIVLLRPSLAQLNLWKNFMNSQWNQSKWLLLTAMVQWWSGNLFVVMSGVFISIEALGAFRLVQSLFGVLNILLQTFENYVLPQASSLLHESAFKAKRYLKSISIRSFALFIMIISVVFVFSEQIIQLAGGAQYVSYAYVIKGMSVLYLIIFIGYPIRLSIRALILNKNFFLGYLISLGFSLISFKYLLHNWGLIGAISGLIASQIIVLTYWQFILIQKKFILWK